MLIDNIQNDGALMCNYSCTMAVAAQHRLTAWRQARAGEIIDPAWSEGWRVSSIVELHDAHVSLFFSDKARVKRFRYHSDPEYRRKLLTSQVVYSRRWLGKPGVKERQARVAAEAYRKKRAELGLPPLRVGRDPEKRKASRSAWLTVNRARANEQKRAWEKRRGKRKLSAGERLLKRARDQRARIRAGRTPMLHQAHVKLWQQQNVIAARSLHDAHVATFFSDNSRTYVWRYHHDVEFRLRELVRRQIRKKVDSKERVSELIRSALKRSGESATISALLGWSIADLRASLQAQLPAGVSLHALGAAGYHIDHIIPKRFFNLSTLEGVREYWALENLRPLPALENIRKHDRLEVDLIV